MEEPDLRPEYVCLSVDAFEESGFADEPATFVREFAGTVGVYDHGGDVLPIGHFRLKYVDVEGAINENVGTFDVFDISDSTIDYFALYDGLGAIKESIRELTGDEALWAPNLLILDRLTIEPQYRGRHLGLAALRVMMLNFKAGAGLIVMKPFPLQFEGRFDGAEEFARLQLGAFERDERKAAAALRRYYGRLGFKRVPGTPFMVCGTDRRLPSVDELVRAQVRPKRRRAAEQRPQP